MIKTQTYAPGHPGLSPHWTSSMKDAVGSAVNRLNRVWFTLSRGILNEIYYPRVDRACTRDLGLIVTDGADFFSEEKKDADSRISWMAEGVPAFRLVNTCKSGRYQIEKKILADPNRHALLQWTSFRPKQGALTDYHLYVLLAPHLNNRGLGNTAWLGDFKGIPMLMAEHDGAGLALACSAPWVNCSAGYVGVSDGWQDLSAHRQLTRSYRYAPDGNVALTGEIDLAAGDGQFVLALGFGRTAAEAGHRARASLLAGFEPAWEQYQEEWEEWHHSLLALDEPESSGRNFYRVSATVLAVHEAEDFPGGAIASLSIPWGRTRSDEELGGYHLVWPRDNFAQAGALLAAGVRENAQQTLWYFATTQEADGHWPQNMWLEGSEYWKGIQLDETAEPILLLDLVRRYGALSESDARRLWPMVRRAAGYLVRKGPATQQDRWEALPGFATSTLPAEIAALLVAADLADENGEAALGEYLRQTADAWNEAIEDWCYVSGTDLARRLGVEGYYLRIVPLDARTGRPLKDGMTSIHNRPAGEAQIPTAELVSPDALCLVRYGLRDPHDPRILDTIKVIDALLKLDTPYGPAWHRFNNDGYGEHADGSAFNGTGIGRAWPLLTGERAHYEIAAGNLAGARRLLVALERFADDAGLISEQIWDAPDIPERGLFFGRPTGSARPLVWAHAEHLKLLRSLREERVFDMPQQTVQRYLSRKTPATHVIWRFNHRLAEAPAGRRLRLEALAPMRVHWSDDDWQTKHDLDSCDTGLGLHIADLPTDQLPSEREVVFTFFWPESDNWEGEDFRVRVAEPAGSQAELQQREAA